MCLADALCAAARTAIPQLRLNALGSRQSNRSWLPGQSARIRRRLPAAAWTGPSRSTGPRLMEPLPPRVAARRMSDLVYMQPYKCIRDSICSFPAHASWPSVSPTPSLSVCRSLCLSIGRTCSLNTCLMRPSGTLWMAGGATVGASECLITHSFGAVSLRLDHSSPTYRSYGRPPSPLSYSVNAELWRYSRSVFSFSALRWKRKIYASWLAPFLPGRDLTLKNQPSRNRDEAHRPPTVAVRRAQQRRSSPPPTDTLGECLAA